MGFQLFDNRILAPLKCGTRYLSKAYTFVHFNYYEVTDFSNIKYLIIRKPYELLKSALHTEFILYKEMYGFEIDFDNFLDELMLKNYCAHWEYNMYEQMYWIYFKSGKKIKVIHLSNLTDFMKQEGYNMKYRKSNYDFHNYKNWINKDEFFNKLLKEFPTQMEILLEKVNIQTLFYNRITRHIIQKIKEPLI
jgi:hypothetical protein